MENRDSDPVVTSAPVHEAVKVNRLSNILAVDSEVAIAESLLSPSGSCAPSSKSGVDLQQSIGARDT